MTIEQTPALTILFLYSPVVVAQWQSVFISSVFQSGTNGVLMAHTEWLPGVRLRYFGTTCAVHIEECEG